MAAMKLHGNVYSTAAQRVLVCLYEKEVDFEFVNIDMRAGEHKKEAFLSLNPFGQVPAFEHGDLKLFESRAITKHLAFAFPEKGTKLVSEGKQMGIQAVWMEVEGHQFDPTASKLMWELIFKPMFGMQPDNSVVEEHEAKLAKVLDVYESRLANSNYLAGEYFTLADMHHLPGIQLLMETNCKELFHSRPRVAAWAAHLLARPAWAKVLAMKNK